MHVNFQGIFFGKQGSVIVSVVICQIYFENILKENTKFMFFTAANPLYRMDDSNTDRRFNINAVYRTICKHRLF